MYINLLTQLKNAQAVKKETVKVLYSKNDEAVLEILQKRNFIEGFEKKGRGVKKILSVRLKYEDNKGAIEDFKLVSRPSRHIYLGYKDIRRIKNGRGLLVLSTPSGIMMGDQARKSKLGGEVFFEIW